MSSTAFKLVPDGVDHFFGDIPITGSTKRTIIVFKSVSGSNVTIIPSAGEIDVDKGAITLNSFAPSTNTTIRITVVPNSLDLAPKRDQLLSIDQQRVTITPEVDTISVSGSSGSIRYTTTPRIK